MLKAKYPSYDINSLIKMEIVVKIEIALIINYIYIHYGQNR